MKKASFVMAILAMACLFPAIAFAVPEMSFDNFKHDFGSITAGEQLHYAFEFSNTGDEDLQITHLKPS